MFRILVLVNMLDVLTTRLALANGATEVNPLGENLIVSLLLKLFGLFVVRVLCELYNEKQTRVRLIMLNLYFACVVLWNVSNI